MAGRGAAGKRTTRSDRRACVRRSGRQTDPAEWPGARSYGCMFRDLHRGDGSGPRPDGRQFWRDPLLRDRARGVGVTTRVCRRPRLEARPVQFPGAGTGATSKMNWRAPLENRKRNSGICPTAGRGQSENTVAGTRRIKGPPN